MALPCAYAVQPFFQVIFLIEKRNPNKVRSEQRGVSVIKTKKSSGCKVPLIGSFKRWAADKRLHPRG